MLVIATFAVGSMVSAYASASRTATPRSFPLIISDDVSQNALSTFIGAFIFSIVALIVTKNGYYEKASLAVLFSITVIVFSIVITTFIHWVDSIARLGRLNSTIEKVEAATQNALSNRRKSPRLGGVAVGSPLKEAIPIFSDVIGYVQRINIDSLQKLAKEYNLRISVSALPGAFVSAVVPLAHIISHSDKQKEFETKKVKNAFIVGNERTFDEDPRFGLIVLSEIAGRALSPAVNDPGTAIQIIGSLVRLLSFWGSPDSEEEKVDIKFDRVEVPEISLEDLFDDAFTAIARDGAGLVEVIVKLQKALISLASFDNAEMKLAVNRHSKLSLDRAKNKMDVSHDIEIIKNLSDSLYSL